VRELSLGKEKLRTAEKTRKGSAARMNGPWSANPRLKEKHAANADNADGAGAHAVSAREREKGDGAITRRRGYGRGWAFRLPTKYRKDRELRHVAVIKPPLGRQPRISLATVNEFLRGDDLTVLHSCGYTSRRRRLVPLHPRTGGLRLDAYFVDAIRCHSN